MSLSRVARLTSLAMNTVRNFGQLQNLVMKNSVNYCLVNNNKRFYSMDFVDSAKNEFDEKQLRKAILEKSLKHIAENGFTFEAILKGTVESGLSSAAAKAIFKNEAFDLIDYFYKKCNSDLAVYLENLVKEGKAMAIQTFNPSYAVQSVENLLRLCDEIWYQVGDDSADLNWYTKRLTLAAIYKSTEFFMIQDESENFEQTIKFLDNRFKDLGNFYQVKSKIDNIGQAVVGSFAVLKNVLRIS